MDKGSYFIKIVEWNLKGQGICFIFRTAERTFPTAECTFRSAEYRNRSAEHRIEHAYTANNNRLYEDIKIAIVNK